FRRVGGLKDLPLDVRVIAASNQDLKIGSEEGRFRLDLYYRLSVIQIDVPPLRERGEDIILLAEHLIAGFNRQFRKRVQGLTPQVAEIFRHYKWPGNVRELRNVIERVMILEDKDVITPSYLPRGMSFEESSSDARPSTRDEPVVSSSATTSEQFRLPPQGICLDDVKLSRVEQAMAQSEGNQPRAAALLGIPRDQLRYRLKKIDSAPRDE